MDKVIPYKGPYEVYVISSLRHWYVGVSYGKTSTPQKRFRAHVIGRGGARMLFDAIQKYGVTFFNQEILEVGYGDPIVAEARWYDNLMITEIRRCLNGMRPGRLNGFIPRFSSEHRAKISASLRGVSISPRHTTPHTQESKRKMSEAHKGVPLTLEHRKNIGLASQGRLSGSTKTRVHCNDCDLITTPLAFGHHRKSTGHSWQ